MTAPVPQSPSAAPPIPLERLAEQYNALSRDEISALFLKGDIGVEVQDRAKQHPLAMEEFCRLTRETPKTIQNHATVARALPHEAERRLTPTWTHARIAIRTDDAGAWLRRAQAGGWTTRRFIQEVEVAGARRAEEAGTPCFCGCGKPLPTDGEAVHITYRRKRHSFAGLYCMVQFYAGELQAPAAPAPEDASPDEPGAPGSDEPDASGTRPARPLTPAEQATVTRILSGRPGRILAGGLPGPEGADESAEELPDERGAPAPDERGAPAPDGPGVPGPEGPFVPVDMDALDALGAPVPALARSPRTRALRAPATPSGWPAPDGPRNPFDEDA